MDRDKFLDDIIAQFSVNPICALLGSRQADKAMLVKMYVDKFFPDNACFFDLENPLDFVRLENPMLALQSVSQKLIVINEIQIRSELFSILRVLVDATRIPLDEQDSAHNQEIKARQKQFLILGSASRDLLQRSSERLAGRISFIKLPPF